MRPSDSRHVSSPLRVLFVCVGNICRSPTAEGVFRQRLQARGLAGCIEADSAGTTAYHVGEAPDTRAQRAARRRGYDLSGIRARQVVTDDFSRYDLLLAMDGGVLSALRRAAPDALRGRVRRFMDFASHDAGGDVPDPYYGGGDGFERVLDMIEDGTDGLVALVRERTRAARQPG